MHKIIIIIGGILSLFAFYLIWLRVRPISVSAAVTTLSSQKIPVEFIYPTLALDLPIIPASREKGVWQLSDNGISYLVQSPLPGMPGNSVLYGHNWPNLLGPLDHAKPGQVFSIRMSDGKKERFVVQRTERVMSDELHILSPSNKRKITIYTCAGLFDTQRFVVEAYSVE
jgi:sortase (surface protein transpeptidase)